METKLTLRMKKRIIEKAKKYARLNNTSLSKMIENYLDSITSEAEPKSMITPLVESLSGVIHLDVDQDLKKEYSEFLGEKYQ